MAADITTSRSADAIGSIDDLLMRILLRLPVKPLMRFKLVSKHWKSLITSRYFSLLHYPGPNPAVGLFYPGYKISEFDYIHFGATNVPPPSPPFRKLSFPEETSSFWIHQSCNGLLLCCSLGGHLESWGCFANRDKYPIRICYVYNPTTNCFTKLPRPGVVHGVPRIVLGVNLAFDHSFYKVVCVRGSEFDPNLLQIEIYSAESGAWRVSGQPFSSNVSFKYGVYWNGSIHWINYEPQELLYFHVDNEKFGKMALPVAVSESNGRGTTYFGESCDHLHVIGSVNNRQIAFEVYELKRDYSEWFVKYQVDLTIVAAAFPKMACRMLGRTCYEFYVFSLIRGVEEQDSFLVVQLSGTIVRFNLDSNTFEEIPNYRDGGNGNSLPRAFEYIESIACV